ncbi:UNVERIFIED_CONTAM: hypothetical protein GTU68_010985 [Idotea baltica]|nr:hypothetical protein [Idotea baltica]
MNVQPLKALFNNVAGVDEVGRGPLCGAVVTAAVILDENNPIQGIKDSKKLTLIMREKLYDEICTKALAWSIGRAEAKEIDQLNILQATMLAMQRAVMNLPIVPDRVVVDGNMCPQFKVLSSAIVKGDALITEIAAASILAKVTRDREMVLLDKQYPGYGLAQHKGYPTKMHLEALFRLGVTPIHRCSFAPVKRALL